MSLKITEEWIKDRIKLDYDKIEDVKSLALPGSYHEKIGSLSTSLSNFSRLQQLDVSRNAIASLDGLSHLKYLETVNLYYNSIPDLKEVFKLRKNQSLKVLDLRLNPVTKTEPDYRLFVVHMLPLLRRLDDRPVRDSERKAALLHFSSEQATEMVNKTCYEEKQPDSSKECQASSQARAEYVRNMIKRPTVVTDDDTCLDMIDLMNRNGGDIRNPRAPTGGVRKNPEMEPHTHSELYNIARKDDKARKGQHLEDHDIGLKGHEMDMPQISELNGYGKLSSIATKKTAPIRDALGASYTDNDEDDAYMKFKSVANFTRHPGTSAPPPTAGVRSREVTEKPVTHDRAMTPESCKDEYSTLPKHLTFGDSESTKSEDFSSVEKNSAQDKFVDEFLDVVDRYWNGTKSLHYHKKFRTLIEKPLSKYESSLTSSNDVQLRVLEDKLATKDAENKSLRTELHSLAKSSKSGNYDSQQKDLDALRSRLQLSMSDNKILRKKISELEEQMRKQKGERLTYNNEHMAEVEKQKRSLVQQVASLKLELKNYESLDELSKMLQQSHKALIATNERLLTELDDTRNRHQSEIEQLKWSYDQLRKTNQLVSNGRDSSFTNGY